MLPVPPRKPPKVLGRFEVGAKIGGGGMATVYLGRNLREDGTEELVALKVIRDELANDEQFTAMFIDEAKILARLSHPNVIQTLEYGVTGAHRYIAMELLNGRTIADAWDVLTHDGEKFTVGMAAWICARVAEGMHSAHELVDETGSPLNVIHRDVNPTNIFLTHSGEVKLIDFGLARARVRVSKSAEGIVKGKIPYLAPEQALGQPIDRRIDIYALGTTLWEMATMKRLFKRDTDVDTLKAIRDAAIPDPRETIADFPDALWRIIERALRRDRDERYATAEEMRTDLDAFARGSAPHIQKLSTLVSRLFPGGEARQAKWMRDAAAIRIPVGTMAPPAPVPIASSSLLEDDNDPPSMPKPPRLPPPTLPPRKKDSLPAPAPVVVAKAESTSDPVAKAESTPEAKAKSTPEAKPDPVAKAESTPVANTVEDPRDKAGQGLAGAKARRAADTKKRKKSKKSKRVDAGEGAAAAPGEDKRKLWMIVGGVVVVLLMAAAFASR